MSDTAVHFSDAGAAEQEAMGVETGFDEQKSFVFLGELVSAWKEAGRLDVLLLRAICLLSIENPRQASLGFTSWDLVETISKIRGRAWSDRSDKARMSDDIRQQWNKLLTTWDTKSEGVAQQLSDAYFPRTPKPLKTEGGGTGNPTLHRIEWVIPKLAPVTHDPAPLAPAETGKAATVRYVCEDIEEANPFARIFSRGFQLKGWRRQLYIVVLGGPLLLLWLLFVQVTFGITLSYTVGAKSILTSLLSLGIVYWAVWASVGRLYQLGSNNIVIAPWWMQSVDDDRLLERRVPPRYRDKTIKAVRYVAPCPLCGGRILATSGRLEFFGRIVGRCEEAPVEHVFSFDHVTRNGKCLR
ncbi:MAG TPA: hypothetical protein V6D19_16450 [Stenomitos sp.]